MKKLLLKIVMSMCIFCASAILLNVQAQSRVTVSGVVSDASGPIVGASVVEKGTTNGITTNVDGQYTLTVAPAGTLVVSFLGYREQEIPVEGRSVINIELVEDAQALQEVVVIGYGTLDKKQVTSSITSLKASDLPTGVGGASIANAMKGKVNNLAISETASPNSGLTLQLRGMASVNTSAAPLVVIDGMPGGDIRSVAQEDIQSIDFLKDASAGAIYGTRANGGVILITTKQAKDGKMRLSYTGEVMSKSAFGEPRVMNAKEFISNVADATNYGGDVDWWDAALTDNPTSQRHVLTMQGGSQDAKIYSTVMYEDNRGVMLYDTRQDVGGRINGQFRVLDGWLEINPRVSYRQAHRFGQANPSWNIIGDAPPQLPGVPVFYNPTRDPNDPTKWDTSNPMDPQNPITDGAQVTNQGLEKWFSPTAEGVVHIKPIEGLTYHHTLGYENHQYEWQYYAPSTVKQTEWQNRGGKGTGYMQFNKWENFNTDGYFSYIRQFGDSHYLNAVAGFNYNENNAEGFAVKNLNFPVDGVKMWDIGSGENLNNPLVSDGNLQAKMASSKSATERIMAYFVRANYSYKDTYLAAVSLRREGSSKFWGDNKWGNFYSVSGGWRISNEYFWDNIKPIVNDFKIRASYGETGNAGFNANYAAIMYSSSGYWVMPDGSWAQTYGQAQNVNNDLKWEEKHEWNVGLDFELLNRRFFGKFDLYSRKTVGLIYSVNVPVPPYTLATMYKNIGDLSNKGWEIELGGEIYSNRNFSYSTKLNLSHNFTKIGKMADADQKVYAGYIGRAGNVHMIEQGAVVGSFYLYKYAGLTSNGEFQAIGADGSVIVPEVDGKNLADKQFIGNYQPQVQAGWTHNLTWKNWALDITLTSWIKFDIYNQLEHEYGTLNGIPGSNRNYLLSAYTTHKDMKGQTLECDYFLEDGTFLKIQNAQLSYTLNTKKILPLLESARFYLTGNNLYTFTGYSGLNPEVDITGWGGGIESVVYPQTRTFAFGVQLNF
ncbi:MAG: SusC/RagA family TonB-linked outer membrane protein [Dysgonamonadaceae bacterium]|jgi:TonB-linked SusC/RagA family outer membrane protein|nr:SusC/RagA family TonB-linked outer membrane protein [Dysgonamonadaceae bacterium]